MHTLAPRRSPALRAAAVLSLVLGCAPTVETLGDDDTGDSVPDPPPDPEPCSLRPSETVTLGAIEGGALLDGVLYAGATIDGVETVALIDLASAPPVLLASRPDLVGIGPWVPSGLHRWVAVHDGSVEVLDTTDRTEPVLSVGRPLDGGLGPGFEGVYTFANDALFACLSSSFDGESYLTGLSLTDPDAPPVRLVETPCTSFGARASAEGALWIDWDPDGLVLLYDLTQARGIDSHSFVTDGAHHYGFITSVATDGALTATTVENDHYAFFYYAEESPHIVYTSFGAGEKKLLEIADGQAVVAFPSEEGASIGSFAMLPRPAPETPAARTSMAVALLESSTDLASLRVLGHDGDRLIVTDGVHLWDVRVGASGELAPMIVAREGTPTCDD